MKKLICILLVAAMLFACTSCGSKGANKNIIYPIDSSPETLDPQYANEISAQIAVNNLFEGLVRHDSNGKIINGIAKSWKVSDDGLTYTFKLRDDTEWYCTSAMKKEYGNKFYNKFCEEKVTAYDFEFACKRTIDPETDSPLANRMMVLKGASAIHAGEASLSTLGVTAKNKTTLVFQLEDECEDFLDRLTESEFMPCNEEFFNATNGRYGLGSVYTLCNGPFYLSYWDPENYLTMKRNKYYSGSQEVVPSSVTLTIDNDPESISSKLSNGTVSAALLSPVAAVPEKCTAIKEIDNAVCGLIFNCSDKVLGNESIRKALCMTVDRSTFTVPKGMKQMDGLVPNSCLAGSDTYRNKVGNADTLIGYDEVSAAKYLNWGIEEIGVSTPSITILCPESLDTQLRNQLQIWQRLFGFKISIGITNMTDAEIDSAIKDGDFQIAMGYIVSDKQNAADFLAGFENGGVFGIKSKSYNNIVENTRKATNDDDMITGCLTAEDYLISHAAFYPLYQKPSQFVLGKDIENVSIQYSESTVSFINARRYS